MDLHTCLLQNLTKKPELREIQIDLIYRINISYFDKISNLIISFLNLIESP